MQDDEIGVEDVGCISLFQLSRAAEPGEMELLAAESASAKGVSRPQHSRAQSQEQPQLPAHQALWKPTTDELCLEVKSWWLAHLIDRVGITSSARPSCTKRLQN